jgi:hypothetical protein
MDMHMATNQRGSGTTSARTARASSGFGVPCSIVIRNASYQTRVSAMRFLAGCATERLSDIRGDARSARAHGVHVVERASPYQMLGSGQGSRSG